jgi:hypothetical protein
MLIASISDAPMVDIPFGYPMYGKPQKPRYHVQTFAPDGHKKAGGFTVSYALAIKWALESL